MSAVTGRSTLLRVNTAGPVPLAQISAALPGLSIEHASDELIIRAADTTDAGALNARVLPVLLAAQVTILEVHQGTSLEAAFLADRAAAGLT
jgi:hypothetical protein